MAALRIVMANLALIYHWEWQAMMDMPVSELLAFHDLAIKAGG